MIKHLFVAAVVAAGAAFVSPVFASSGYGPAPHYDPLVGAPASQRGQSALTVQAESVIEMASADDVTQAYGGMPDSTSQAGARIAHAGSPTSYSHH